MKPIRVLCLEDSAADAELAQAILAQAGLDCAVTRVESREAYLAALEAGGFDLIISEMPCPDTMACRRWPGLKSAARKCRLSFSRGAWTRRWP
ncbi:MAG: hypothetical protein ACREVK_09605 [Gammaproteobacteria bacterium]